MNKIFTILCTLFSITNTISLMPYLDLQKTPKAELHIHLGGAYPLPYLQTIATLDEYQALHDAIQRFSTGVDYTACFFIFEIIARMVNTTQKVADGTYAVCKMLAQDGVTYAEIRTGLKDLGSGYEEYLNAVLAGIARAQHENFQARVLLSIKRSSSVSFVHTTVDLAVQYKYHGVVGIDISDNATVGDITPLIPILQAGKQHGLAIVAHVGESSLETDQMLILEHLEPARIGHGVHLTPAARAWVFEHKIPVEVCLSSSVCARMLDAYEQHPGFELYMQQHPIVLCTDDPLIFTTTLTQEYLRFGSVIQASAHQLHQLAAQSFLYRLSTP